MRARFVVLILIVVLLTVFIMQNSEQASFHVFFENMMLSTRAVLAAVAVLSFILGLSIGKRPKARPAATDEEYNSDETRHSANDLSDEDKDYIN